MANIDVKKILLWVLSFEIISMAIGYLTKPEVAGWYKSLNAPEWTPPNYIFPIMWTTLYAMLAIVGYLLWNSRDTREGRGMFSAFTMYMVLNWAWSFVFFSMHLIFPALVFIGAMNALLGLMIVFSYRVKPAISLLLIPTFLWSSFAMYLNAAYFLLN